MRLILRDPRATINDLPYCVEVAGMSRGLGNHVEQNLAQVIQPEFPEEVGPSSWRRIQRSSADHDIGPFNLASVSAKDDLRLRV